MSEVFIGIDQSYSAFALSAYYPVQKESRDCLWKYPPGKYGMGIDRLNRIEADVGMLIYEISAYDTVAHVCMEGYSRESKFRREEMAELGVTVKRALRGTLPAPQRYPTIVAPPTLKKYVTGHGHASKDQMIAGVEAKWGRKFVDHNLADAYSLARLAELVSIGHAADERDREVLTTVNPFTEQFPKTA